MELVGTVVYRDFVSRETGEDLGYSFGTVVEWLPERDLFRVVYEDDYERLSKRKYIVKYIITATECVSLLKNSDNRAQTFAAILRRLTANRPVRVRYMMPHFYERLSLEFPCDVGEIKPCMWGSLGHDATEKFHNAAKILEMVIHAPN